MSGFDPDWLRLREPADARARSAALIARAGRGLTGRTAPTVCDLGAGTGASVRAFGPFFPPDVRWLLVDGDAGCLEIARAEAGRPVETRVADLASLPDPWPADCALVTATALFDLAAGAWIEGLAGRLTRDRLPLLACLTYDGAMRFDPPDPGDARIKAGFDAHQRTDKGLGGPAAGPEAADRLAAALRSCGYAVWEAQSPWVLEAGRDAGLLAALLPGLAGAAVEIGAVSAAEAETWVAARSAGLARLTLGHRDLYAVPAG